MYVVVITSRSLPMLFFLPVAIGQNNTVYYVNWLGWALNAEIPRLKYVKIIGPQMCRICIKGNLFCVLYS